MQRNFQKFSLISSYASIFLSEYILDIATTQYGKVSKKPISKFTTWCSEYI